MTMILLQAIPTSYTPFGIIALALGFLLIYIILTRWVFKIDEQVRNQQTTIYLLMKIAEKQGVSKEQIDIATKVYRIK